MSHVELSVKAYQVRLYDTHPDNYTASFQVYIDGDKGFIHSLSGKGFYKLIGPHIRDVFAKVNIVSLEGYMIHLHAVMMKKLLENELNVEFVSDGDHSGRKMVWVKLTLKSVGE